MYLMYADESGNTGTDYDNKDQPIFVLGSISIEHTDWHKINDYFNERKIEIFKEFKDIDFGFTTLYNDFSDKLEKNNVKGMIFLDEIIDIPQALNKIYPELSANKKSIIEQALFLKSKDTNFIQIADIFSFYVCQYLNIIKGNKKYSDFKEKHCIDNYNKLITKTNKKYLI